MVVFYTLRLPCETPSIAVQKSEVSAFVWLPPESLRKVLAGEACEEEIAAGYVQTDGTMATGKVPLERIARPYPNEWKDGLAGGHLKALRKFVELHH